MDNNEMVKKIDEYEEGKIVKEKAKNEVNGSY